MSLLNLDSLLALVDAEGSDAYAAFLSSQNAKCRRFGRAKDALTEVDLGAQTTVPGNFAKVHLALGFDPGPKDVSKGFVFGSDPQTCDVLLANNKHGGVSGNHFSISVDWQTGNPLITSLTPNEGATGIHILIGSLWVLYLRNAWKVVDPGLPITIKISDQMHLVVHNPGRKTRETAYIEKLQSYFEKCQDNVPEMAHLRLFDPEPTPLLVSRGRGLTGMEYFTTKTIVGNKVVLGEARSYQDLAGVSKLFVVKRFHNVRGKWPDRARITLPYLRLFQHRHTIVPEDIITDGTEYMPVYLPEPAESLADRQARERLTEIDAGDVLAQVFEGLSFLHKILIIHGGLYPGNIMIKHSDPWWIKLSDIGLHPYVELEDSKERTLYASHPRGGHTLPVPSHDTWSAGVVGLSLLSPRGLPPRSGGKQHHWTLCLAQEAQAFYAAERSSPRGKKDAALFLTRVLKYVYPERLTAEQCLQDPWIQLWRLPASYNREFSRAPNGIFSQVPGSAGSPRLLSDAGSVYGEAENAEGSGKDTENKEPSTSSSKGKQPQTSRY